MFLQRRHTDGQEHRKSCSASLTIIELQIKATMRYHLTALRMAITKKNKTNKQKKTNKTCWKGCGGKETLLHFGGNLSQCSYSGKQCRCFSENEK